MPNSLKSQQGNYSNQSCSGIMSSVLSIIQHCCYSTRSKFMLQSRGQMKVKKLLACWWKKHLLNIVSGWWLWFSEWLHTVVFFLHSVLCQRKRKDIRVAVVCVKCLSWGDKSKPSLMLSYGQLFETMISPLHKSLFLNACLQLRVCQSCNYVIVGRCCDFGFIYIRDDKRVCAHVYIHELRSSNFFFCCFFLTVFLPSTGPEDGGCVNVIHCLWGPSVAIQATSEL